MKKSKFKTNEGRAWLEQWNQRVLEQFNLPYQAKKVATSFGETHIWAHAHEDKEKPALLFLPGFRTCGLFWDFNQTLKPFYKNYRIYLVDVIGQASLSGGETPPIKTDGYGHWLKEILDALELDKVVACGASFGGQLMVKLATVAPERVQCLVGFNPVGIQYISMGMRAMWYNALHMLFPTQKNIDLYMEKMVLDPRLNLNKEAQALLMEYQYYVIPNFKFGCNYPYKFANQELEKIETPVYLILCKDDQLITQEKTAARAQELLPNFRKAFFLSQIGHGIEVAPQAYTHLQTILETEGYR